MWWHYRKCGNKLLKGLGNGVLVGFYNMVRDLEATYQLSYWIYQHEDSIGKDLFMVLSKTLSKHFSIILNSSWLHRIDEILLKPVDLGLSFWFFKIIVMIYVYWNLIYITSAKRHSELPVGINVIQRTKNFSGNEQEEVFNESIESVILVP